MLLALRKLQINSWKEEENTAKERSEKPPLIGENLKKILNNFYYPTLFIATIFEPIIILFREAVIKPLFWNDVLNYSHLACMVVETNWFWVEKIKKKITIV